MKRAIGESLLGHSPKAIHALKKAKATDEGSTSPAVASLPTVHTLKSVVFGKLEKRYKRFLTDVVLDESGETVVAHCPNTGPLLGLIDDPSPAVLLSKSADPKRKFPYTLEAIRREKGAESSWIGIHSALANKMVHSMLKQKQIPEFKDYDTIRAEAVYGKDKKSRADFLLSTSEGDRCIYVEVKAITYSEERDGVEVGLFPDTKSTRAQKHLNELMHIKKEGVEVACVFVVLGNPCNLVGPFKEKDAKFAELLKKAQDAGVIMIGIGLELAITSESDCDFVFKRFLDVKADRT